MSPNVHAFVNEGSETTSSSRQRQIPRITQWLSRSKPTLFATYAITAAFTAYFCMYGFRKPFAVAAWEGVVHLGFLPPLTYKSLLIISQVLGYCLSKFIGIKVIAEMAGHRRAFTLIALIGFAEVALLFFALVPAPYSAFCLFLNGLPLGMIWGLVFGFLEGRKLSEVLGAGLSASYILASAFVKSVGQWLVNLGVPEPWMPFITGLLFFPPLLLAVWMLRLLPPPNEEDRAARTKRAPMDRHARHRFVRLYAPGVVVLTILYMLLTAYRDFRDNFARELWAALGYADQPEIFTISEIPITVIVLISLAAIMLIRNNRRALLTIHGIMLAGSLLIVLSTGLWQLHYLGSATWMICVGLGLYIAYVPYGCILFDRLIATVGFVGTAGFLIYITDAFGYLGSICILLYKDFGQAQLSWLEFFVKFSYLTGVFTALCFAGSWIYFAWRTRLQTENSPVLRQ